MLSRPPAQMSRVSQIELALQHKYPTAQYYAAQFFTEHLADCGRAFGGDLQQMLILAVIGQTAIQDAPSNRGEYDPARHSINASRIADVCGIPRETVRRKLKTLERKGWIEQSADHSWHISMVLGRSPARRGLSTIDGRGINRIATLFYRLEKLVTKHAELIDERGDASSRLNPPSEVAA